MSRILKPAYLYRVSLCLLALSLLSCERLLSGQTFAANDSLPTTHAGDQGANIILLQQPGLPTRTRQLGLETSAAALNTMAAAGFTVTTYDPETGIGTEYGLMKDGRPVAAHILEQQLAELPRGITKDVYIEVIMDRPGELLDEAAWRTVTENFSHLAEAATNLNTTGDYNFKGIVIDNEDYNANIFDCDAYDAGTSCQAYRDTMLRRGEAVMQAVLDVWPDVTVMQMHGPYTSDCDRPAYVAGVGVPCSDLKGSFFAGMVRAVSKRPNARPLVNGGQDYVLVSSNDFQNHYNYVEAMGENGIGFIPPALRSQWATNVETSFMVYNKKIVYNRQTRRDARIVPHRDLNEPRTQLQNAKCVADRLVWFYIEDDPEADWYYAMPNDWLEQVVRPALEYQCPDAPETSVSKASRDGQ